MAKEAAKMKVPFNKPCFIGEELECVKEAVQTHGHLAGCGAFTKKCEMLLKDMLGVPTLLTTSATHALELSALLLDLKAGDEVILPSFTFVSSANPYILRGASIRFVDNDEFGNIDVAACEKAINSKTRAIVAVHYAGNSADVDKLVALCKKHKIHLVEDAAQSIGVKFKGKPLGTFGTFGCFSFHDTKNITSGEGGALVINDPAFIQRAEILREKGTNRSLFFQGLVDKYTWVDMGSSYVLSEINAAYLYPQLKNVARINAKRGEIWKRYEKALRKPLEAIGARLLEIPAHNTPNYHLFAILFKAPEQRIKFISTMRESGVTTPFHYVALHTSPMGRKFISPQDASRELKNCARFSECLVRLPLFYGLNAEDVDYVVESALEVIETFGS